MQPKSLRLIELNGRQVHLICLSITTCTFLNYDKLMPSIGYSADNMIKICPAPEKNGP